MTETNEFSRATAMSGANTPPRWDATEARDIYHLPFNDLLFRAQTVHRAHFDPNTVQLSRLLSIKTGGCPEDCGYCSQSAHPDRAQGLQADGGRARGRRSAQGQGGRRHALLPGGGLAQPEAARPRPGRRHGPGRQGARHGNLRDARNAVAVAGGRTRAAGLDYYNHNIDTSERFYSEIITTRSFADRLETLDHVREAGIKVCAGGILGMGETADDRIDMLLTLANLPVPPESVPINMLIPMPGTKLADVAPVDPIDFIRIIALARILMPQSHVRLTAGRTRMSDEMQALCFFAGANSIFVGDTLLTAANPGDDRDSEPAAPPRL